MKFLNQTYKPSDCDIHHRLMKATDEVPANLSIRIVRLLLLGASEKYISDWRDKAIMLRLKSPTTLTIGEVTKHIKLI